MQLGTVRAHDAVGESIKICLSCTQQKALYTSIRKLVSPASYKKHIKTKDKFQAASCKLQAATRFCLARCGFFSPRLQVIYLTLTASKFNQKGDIESTVSNSRPFAKPPFVSCCI